MFSIRRRRVFPAHRGPTVAIVARVRRRRMLLLPALAVCAALSSPAFAARTADVLPIADRRAIEHVIRRQLEAFGRDDAPGAFAVATPDIQRLFGSADRFLSLVREEYGPVYRPASVRFVGLERVDGEWVQTVLIADAQGKVWRALYTMRRQADRAWKVGGCQLVETDALET